MKISFKIIILVVLLLVLAGLAAAAFLLKKELQTPSQEIETNTLIEIKGGEGAKEISADLKALGLIKSKELFYLAAIVMDKKMKPGFYEVTPNMSSLDILNMIDAGHIKLVKVTFPEGWRTEQMAQKLADNKIISYSGFLSEAKQYEGKLFPDTYFFNPRMEAKDIIKMMLDDYESRTASLGVKNETLILASIVEREASKDSERGLIAGVYANRIQRKMKLEADPTVQYGRDDNSLAQLTETAKESFVFWKGVSISDYLKVDSSYNTYLIAGLPPKPICNPGLKSIEAALNPEKHNYLYFLQKDGEIYPSETPAQHDYYRATVLGAYTGR